MQMNSSPRPSPLWRPQSCKDFSSSLFIGKWTPRQTPVLLQTTYVWTLFAHHLLYLGEFLPENQFSFKTIVMWTTLISHYSSELLAKYQSLVKATCMWTVLPTFVFLIQMLSSQKTSCLDQFSFKTIFPTLISQSTINKVKWNINKKKDPFLLIF